MCAYASCDICLNSKVFQCNDKAELRTGLLYVGLYGTALTGMELPYLEDIRDHTTSVSQSVFLPNPVADKFLVLGIVECCPQVSWGEHLALACKSMPFVRYGMQQNRGDLIGSVWDWQIPGDLFSMGCSKTLVTCPILCGIWQMLADLPSMGPW